MTGARVDDVFEIIPHRAQGYQKGPGGALQNSGLADTSYKIPGGGLCATAPDLARFTVALWNGTLVRAGDAPADVHEPEDPRRQAHRLRSRLGLERGGARAARRSSTAGTSSG